VLQGPKDGFIVFKGESGMIIGEGPVLAVSVGHVGLSVTFDYQDGSYGLGYGTHTGMPSAGTHAILSLVIIRRRRISFSDVGHAVIL